MINGFLISIFTVLVVLPPNECIAQKVQKTSGTIYFADGNQVRFVNLKYLAHHRRAVAIDDNTEDGAVIWFEWLKSFEVISVDWSEVSDSDGTIAGYEALSDSVKIVETNGDTTIANVPDLDAIIVDILDTSSGKYIEKEYHFVTVNVPVKSENRILIRKIVFSK